MCHGHGNRDFEVGKECIVCTVFFYHWPRCAPSLYDSWHPDFVLSQSCVVWKGGLQTARIQRHFCKQAATIVVGTNSFGQGYDSRISNIRIGVPFSLTAYFKVYGQAALYD